jgi:DedD protein
MTETQIDSRLKQRVVGAIVLTALAIIVLPMLLDGTPEDRARVVANIPEPPRIELKSVSVPGIKARMAEREAASAAAMPKMVQDTETEESVAPEAFTLDANDLPVSWSLQLASFKNPDNALNLRKSLRDSEFSSYVIQANTEEGDVYYRVFVGPMLQKSRLAKISEQIEEKFDLKGQIVRYRLEDDKGQLGG